MRWEPQQPRGARHAAIGVGLIALVSACNMLTGAEDVEFNDDNHSESIDGIGQATGPAAQTGAGAGGATSATTGAGAGNATTATGATTVASTAASTGSGAVGCEYPAGPYGVAQGQVVPPNLSWQGYAPGASSPSTISIQDLFDCDGSRGIHAIVVDTSQYG